jgi:hypothetical protein
VILSGRRWKSRGDRRDGRRHRFEEPPLGIGVAVADHQIGAVSLRVADPLPGTRGTAPGGGQQGPASTQMPGAVPDSGPVVRLDAQSEIRARPRAGQDQCAAVPARQRGQSPGHLRTGLCRRAREHQRAPIGQRGDHVGPPLARVVDEQNPHGIKAAARTAHPRRGADVNLRQADDGAPFLTEAGRQRECQCGRAVHAGDRAGS